MCRSILVLVLSLVVATVFSMPQTVEAASKKPGKVNGIRVTSTAYNEVNFKWNKTKNAKKYEIYRAEKRGGKFIRIKTISGVKFKNIRVKTGTTYWYKVRATNGLRKGKFSKVIKGTPNLKKPAFSVTSSSVGPRLTAGKVAGATGYIFYRDGKIIATQKKRNYVDKAVAINTPHTYKVKAYKKVGQKNVTSPFSRALAASKCKITVKLKDCNKVSSLKAGKSFDISGTITSNIPMKRIELGFVDRSTNKWVSGAKYDKSKINAREFDIKKAKASINFKKLYGGTFSYRIYAHMEDGSTIVVLNHTFVVSSGEGATAIVKMAKQCAWPYGTPKSKYKYKTGKRTEAYTAALKAAYGDRSGWGKQTKAGASCDVFVGTVIRASGYDKKFPRGLDGVEKHCRKNKDKWKLTGIKSVSDMQPGDIVFQLYKGGGGHILVYLGNDRVANAHYVSKTYGIIEGKGLIQSKSRCRTYNVYRPIK